MALSDSILDRLLLLHPKLIDLSLDRVEGLLSRLGDPHLSLSGVIHVAGTNGKGSVVAYLRHILALGGYGVHSYISPHLVRFHERIRLADGDGGHDISEDYLVALLEECERVNDGDSMTFFEVTTVAALLAFSRHLSDFQILETGLGGRLDATNVVPSPLVSVITSIDYDHQQFLGSSLAEIAFEKAGILKAGCPAVIGVRGEESVDVIRAQGERVGARLYSIDEDWHVGRDGDGFIYEDGGGVLRFPLPSLCGDFQIVNAGISVAVLRLLERSDKVALSDSVVARGLRETRWRGRMERLGDGYLRHFVDSGTVLWLDGGHNGGAAIELARSFRRILDDGEAGSLDMICAMMETKDPHVFLRPFSGLVRHVTALAIPGEENAHPAGVICDAARALLIDCDTAPDLESALRARDMVLPRPSHLLLCGSLYFAGYVLSVDEKA